MPLPARGSVFQGRGELRAQPTTGRGVNAHRKRQGLKGRGELRDQPEERESKQRHSKWHPPRGAGNCATSHDGGKGERPPQVATAQGLGELRGQPPPAAR
jgi:hypothetical protein